MLYYSGLFVVAAFISAVMGFKVLSGPFSWIPKVAFVLFMVLFVISFHRGRHSK